MTDAEAPPLLARFAIVRSQTEQLCEPLANEDYGLQSVPEASPAKWHLAHTTWFFERFVLARDSAYQPFHPKFDYLFNSYYDAVGPRHPRAERGLLSRPTVTEVYAYRRHVDGLMHKRLLSQPAPEELAIVELGLHHEQQHQELLLTDLKHAFALNPLAPVYRPEAARSPDAPVPPSGWMAFPARLRAMGHDGTGFAFDNELPRHRVFVEAFQIATRLVTNGEYWQFMKDDGYERPELWLADGWAARRQHGWTAPLYWRPDQDRWLTFTLGGLRAVHPAEPVTHISYYEADAFARWAGHRLPTEAEWETAVEDLPVIGNSVESGRLHPARGGDDVTVLQQMFGDGWEWTSSAYAPYPGYRPPSGALGEYNGKFMCNQMVLRGGSCVSPISHLRGSYRNFFPPESRWQFTAIRLASSL